MSAKIKLPQNPIPQGRETENKRKKKPWSQNNEYHYVVEPKMVLSLGRLVFHRY